jgi:general secretion pathway protein G
MLAVMSIIGFLAGFGIPRLHNTMKAASIARAIGDIGALQTDLEAIEAGSQPLPASLAAIGRGTMVDPWGNPYQYANLVTTPGAARLDRFGVPINSHFDVYSLGPDGATATPLTAAASQDDIVRGNDGGYVGLGSNY